MKEVKIFERRKDVRELILDTLIVASEFHNEPFYAGLINWIIDYRSPIFFKASAEYEYSHFTQYLNYILIRESYENKYLQSLYYIHDFLHMIFYNPIPPQRLCRDKFHNLAITNEYIASNETEVLTYYRVPTLRNYTVSKTILYDILRAEISSIPSVKDLLDLRIRLIKEDLTAEELCRYKEVLPFFRRFNENNKIWCDLWYDHFPTKFPKSIISPPYLPYCTYAEQLTRYRSAMSDRFFRKLLEQNVTIGLTALNKVGIPDSNPHQLMDGQILLDEVAKRFHTLYLEKKLQVNSNTTVTYNTTY